jgi:hypothetical protein
LIDLWDDQLSVSRCGNGHRCVDQQFFSAIRGSSVDTSPYYSDEVQPSMIDNREEQTPGIDLL